MDIPDISLYFLDRDFTDLPDKIWQAGYTALYFINAAAFMKWKYCLNNDTIVHGVRPGLGYMRPVGSDPTNPWPSV